ncbi:MAG: thermonuclease family protein [Verrucomicrobiales bacterium]
MAKKKTSMGWTILLIVVAVGVKFFQERDGATPETREEKAAAEIVLGPENPEGNSAPAALTGRFSEPGALESGWEELTNCRLITGRNSDGDSFHVRHAGGEAEFRLYYVDTPESAYKTYRGGENNGERLAEQGAYFGGLDRDDTTTVGKAAKSFVLDLLAERPFTVRTKWENVYGPERKYALVVVQWEGREVYLHELLVAKGLGRIHTRGADLPSGRGWRAQKDYLKDWEAEARSAGLGAWGL